ncbi:MAG: DNA primase [Verrucomicrobia bacterium]|nr:DNA primase [Verrucomicrobiota bacterium]
MAGSFSPATLEQVRAANDIVEVIGSYLPLKRAGANFVTLCPFHKERTPSFNVNPQRQIFHCFGCHKGGDVFRFVQDYENVAFPEAVRRLAERAHIPLEQERHAGQEQARYLKETLLQIHEQITQRWQTALGQDAAGQRARDYLARRAVPADAVKLFRLGYAPDSWEDTVNWAKSKGFELPVVEQAGLILRREGETGYYDRFRGRLMFPICDEQGRVIGFSGRILAEEVKAAKYVNSPETPIFAKRKVCFGLDKSKRAILDSGFAVVCEGQLDLITCFMAGVKNIVAPQGTALTADHARILKRYVDEVVLCFDSDLAGQNAAVRALDDLLASGLAIRVATVPTPHDPDSYIKQFGGAAFQALLERAEGFFDFYLNHLCATNDTGTDKGRLTVVRALSAAAHKTGNAVLIDTCARKVGQRLGVPPTVVHAEFGKNPQAVPRPAAPGQAGEPGAADAAPRLPAAEYWLIKLLLLDETLLDWAAAHLDLEWLQHPLAKQITSARLTAHRDRSWSGIAPFIGQMPEAAASLISEAVSDPRPVPNRPRQLADVLKRLRDQFLDRQLGQLAQQLGNPQLASPERDRLQRQQMELLLRKKQPMPAPPATG